MKYIVFFILVTIITNSVFAQDLVFDLDFKDSPTGILTESELRQQAEEPNMWTLLGNRGKVVNDAERGKVLNVEYPQGAAGPYDAGIQFIKPLPESNEYYLDYYVRFDEGFDFKLGGKLPGLTSGGSAWTGGNRPVNGEGWSARYMWVANGRMLVYLYYIDMPGSYGEDISLNMNFETGRWYRLTQRIKLNDDDVNGNGILQVWVDGNMVVDRNNLRFRLGDKGMIDSFYFSTFHGGSGSDWAPLNDSYTSFDAIKVTKTKPVFELDDNDKTPPAITRVLDTNIGTKVVVEFSESITEASAENPANYIVDGELKVISASLGSDLYTVTLTTTPLDGGLISHNVSASNVEDLNGNKSQNTDASFSYICDAISASSWQQSEIWGYHPPENAFDGDLATKWAADGVGEYIQRRFCSSKLFKSLDIAFWKGDERIYDFSVSVSNDGISFVEIYSGSSSGSSTAPETFDVPDTDAKFIRITGKGSNIDVNNWNNILEIVLDAEDSTLSLSPDDKGNNSLLIYPNPVYDGEFYVKLQSGVPENLKVELYQSNGVRLRTGFYAERDRILIKVNENIQRGTYVLKVYNCENIFVEKILFK